MKERISEVPNIRAEPSAITLDITKLDAMGKDDLISLLRLCNAEQVGYALLTKEEKKEALRLKIYTIAMRSNQDANTLKAANDWLDREEGKPMQRIKQDTTVSFDLKANGALLERMRQKLGGKEPITIDNTSSGSDDT